MEDHLVAVVVQAASTHKQVSFCKAVVTPLRSDPVALLVRAAVVVCVAQIARLAPFLSVSGVAAVAATLLLAVPWGKRAVLVAVLETIRPDESDMEFLVKVITEVRRRVVALGVGVVALVRLGRPLLTVLR